MAGRKRSPLAQLISACIPDVSPQVIQRTLGIGVVVLGLFYAWRAYQRMLQRERAAEAQQRLAMDQQRGEAGHGQLGDGEDEQKTGGRTQWWQLTGPTEGGPRKVLVALNGVCFPERADGTVVLNDGAVTVLCAMAQFHHLVLVVTCADRTEEEALLKLLDEAGLFETGLPAHRVLFCRTEAGRGSIARHLEPSLLIESSASVARDMQRHVRDICLVTTPDCVREGLGRNVHCAEALDTFQWGPREHHTRRKDGSDAAQQQ